MLEGLVQNDYPLTIAHVRDRMRNVYGDSEVVTQTDSGRTRATFAQCIERADRLAAALAALGIEPGDRVATFAWNTQNHLEAYFAVPCMGAVLHTLNIRLFEDQLTYIANHAQDQVVLVEDSLVPVLERVAPTFSSVRHYIVIGDGDAGSLPNALRYEELLADQDAGYDYPELDERQAAGLCYTSGTTGNPKGVLYSHRSNMLHSMGTCLSDAMGLCASDRMLPVVPMFHANAWGIPYAAGLVGTDLVMPARFLQAEPIARMIEEERVTISAAVPDDLDGPAGPPRRARGRPLEHPAHHLRRLGRPAGADAALGARARRSDHPGLGHDRDQPARLDGAAARTASARRSTGSCARDRAA